MSRTNRRPPHPIDADPHSVLSTLSDDAPEGVFEAGEDEIPI
jgi:hypothetical protein